MKLPVVQFLVGTDSFQLRILTEEIRKELFPNGSGGFNDDSYDIKFRSLSEILDQCNTLPMFASHRFVQLRGLEKLKEDDQNLLCNYLENPSPSTILLCIADKLDKRTKVFKVANKQDLIREIIPPKPREMSAWMGRLCKRRGLLVHSTAEQLLLESVGPNLEMLDQQLDKLSLYIHPKNEIGPKDVAEMVLQSSGDDVFTWTDQVLDGKLKEALFTLHHLLDTGDPALVLVSLLARHIRVVLKAIEMLQKGASPHELPPMLGVPPFAVSKYVNQAKRHSKGKLIASLRDLAKLDKDLKSTGLPEQLLLEKMVRSVAVSR